MRIKLSEHQEYITQLRTFLLEHPLLVIELGFRLVLDPTQPYGFDVQRTVPGDRWLRAKQQHLDHLLIQDLFHASAQALQAEIPALGESIAVDVKHIYACVQKNNFRVYCPERFHKDHQPKGDPDCRLGVKSSTNIGVPEGSKKKETREYLWGYGSGIVAALTADYGDVVLAEYTQPFNEGDITYYLPLYRNECLGRIN